MTKFGNVEIPDDARYREGNHGDVDIYDAQYDQFVRVDEDDKVEEFGNGYTVVKKDSDEFDFPEKTESGKAKKSKSGVVTSDDVAKK